MPGLTIANEAGPKSMWAVGGVLEKTLLGAVLLMAFSLPVSIGGAQFAGAAALLLWLGIILRKGISLQWPSFMFPLAIFVALSLTAVVFSINPLQSLYSARSLVVLLVIPLVLTVVDRPQRARAVLAAFTAGGIFTALWGLLQVFLGTGGGESGRRLTGFLGHYMTAGGMLMIVVIALLAVILAAKSRGEKLAALAAVILPLAALGLTQSRNAYVGLAVGCVVVLFLWRPGVVALLPFVLSLAVLLSPPMVRERIFSIADLEDASIRNRFEMLDRGTAIVSDFPIFGAGLHQVETLYPRYKKSESSSDVPHLHNNPLQIAAERGIPAAIVWLWFMAAAFISTARMARAPAVEPWQRIAAMAACGAIAALFTAGMFEYNFGDMEVLIFFFVVLTVPFGISKSSGAADQADES
ncbi:MAG TPA: O-antigen ligase family protein [Acidobacteriota bacterium]|nr:O-antigen ligase family protein [Acidobacteriota bacterium]